LRNVHLKHSDGRIGLPEYAPYDGILVTAAPTGVPEALLEQLKLGGRLVLPTKSPAGQVLVRITRTPEGYRQENLQAVNFVPLLGGTV
jgi:protein-L-isoaspartate(D-aspartate) O-methyltransferase